MPHKVEISDKTFERLKEYCSLNDLKIGQYADKLIYDGLMIEMYGDVPFTTYKVNVSKPIESIVVNGVLTKDGEFKIKEEKEIPVPKEITQEFSPEKFRLECLQEPLLPKEALKEAGVPDKVVRKITKRRLK